MPFKMHKIIFFPEKNKKSVPIQPKFFRPVPRNTLIFYLVLLVGEKMRRC